MMRYLSFICVTFLVAGILFLASQKKETVHLNMDTYEEFSPSLGDKIPLIIEEDGLIKYYREKRYEEGGDK